MTKARTHTKRTPSQNRTSPSSSVAIDAPLSPYWAFVIQFRAVPGGQVYAAGRVEHLVSGQITHFQSLRELTAYFKKELHATDSV